MDNVITTPTATNKHFFAIPLWSFYLIILNGTSKFISTINTTSTDCAYLFSINNKK